MDQSNLRTAATYINNLLLARGLLRNGKPIDFAQLGPIKDRKNEDQSNTTLSAEVINVVHDLILRRDRDQEHHEALAYTLRSLRSESVKSSTTIEDLTRRNDDLKRQLATCQASMRTAQGSAQQAESTAKLLREDVTRLKTLLGQVRTQCANDIRKRDVEMQKLKTHLVARQRGSKTGMIGASITITPGATGRGANNGANGYEDDDAPTTADLEYSLKQESTEFLTQLSQGLSDENDSLISLIRDTVDTLRKLQGLPHNQPQVYRRSAENGSLVQDDPDSDLGTEDLVQITPTSYSALATDLQLVLNSLSDLLTNPSFAPIEEVYVREEEIQRLREGWQKMESRWREAVAMMQGWSKRMQDGGHTINLDELKQGLGLGDGLQGINGSISDVLKISSGEMAAAHEESEDEARSIEIHGESELNLPSEESSVVSEDSPIVPRRNDGFGLVNDSITLTRAGLKEINGNVGARAGRVKTDVGTIKAQNSKLRENESDQLQNRHARPSPSSALIDQSHSKPEQKASSKSQRESRDHRSSPAPQPQLSISQKLELTEQEARRVSASSQGKSTIKDKRQVSERNRPGHQTKTQGLRSTHTQRGRGGVAALSPSKRIKIGGKARRRKSTLSPEELEGLLMGEQATDAVEQHR